MRTLEESEGRAMRPSSAPLDALLLRALVLASLASLAATAAPAAAAGFEDLGSLPQGAVRLDVGGDGDGDGDGWASGHCGVDRPGRTYKTTRLSGASPASCFAACARDLKCRAWVFDAHLGCALKDAVPAQARAAMTVCSGVKTPGLTPQRFGSYPLGTVKPGGWLRTQLAIMANGLTGHLDLFWADVQNSVWVGGSADHSGAGHERGPYWLNGLVPLSALLNASGDSKATGTLSVDVQGQTRKWVEYILDHQNVTTGWLGPDDGFGGPGNSYWSGFNVAASLLQQAEASAISGDAALAARCYKSVLRYVREVHRRMLDTPTASWSQNRWQDWVYIVHWLLDASPQGQEQMLWDAAELTHHQSWDWDSYYAQNGTGSSGAYVGKTMPSFPEVDVGGWTMYDHGVNNAMGTKSNAVWGRQDPKYNAAERAVVKLTMQDKFHGQPHGMFGADECFAGRALNRGIELCAVVEQMYSLYIMFMNLGDPQLLDRAERIAFNALPGTIDPVMWRHQYLQQANSINAKYGLPSHVWRTDGSDSTGFGVAPNFGCCTANMQQGWPKFASMAVFMRDNRDGGVIVAMLSPATLSLPKLGGSVVDVSTDYPFGDTVKVKVTGKIPSLQIRIPSWAHAATVRVNGGTETPLHANGTLWKVPETGSTSTADVRASLNLVIDLKPQIRIEDGWGLRSMPVPTPVVFPRKTIPTSADPDFTFSGGASTATSRFVGAGFDLRSGNPEQKSLAMVAHDIYGLGHDLMGLSFMFRYIAGYGGHNCTAAAATVSVIVAFQNGTETSLWTSDPLGNYSWDAGDNYSPPISVNLSRLELPNAAPLSIGLRFTNNGRNLQIPVDKSGGIGMSVRWSKSVRPGPTPPIPPPPSIIPATNAVAVLRGPILWTVHLEQRISAVVKTWEPFKNTDVSFETDSDWNFALDLGYELTFVPQGGLNKALPFNTSNYFATIEATARKLPAWKEATNAANEPPPSPVDCVAQRCGAPEKITLVPYGATNLRMSGLPWIEPKL